jgi:hypothetical protein
MAELWGSRQIGMIKFAQGQRLFTANYRVMRTTLLFLITFFLSVYTANGQVRRKDRSIMKDTLDGKLDFSRYMVDAKGFLPIPLVITEPALGSFGFVIAPVFLTPKKNVPKNFGYVAPDITAGFGMYTANGSWALGGARIGSIPTKGIKYRFGAAYANVNLSFYRTLSNGSEVETEFNMKTLPVFGASQPCGTNSVPLWLPSQKGWRFESPQAHHQYILPSSTSTGIGWFPATVGSVMGLPPKSKN